jgi:general secretion pathway protein L
MQRIILYLPTNDLTQASVALSNNFGGIQKTIAEGLSVGELALLAADKILTVIVPAQDVLLTQATLPKLNRQRLQQALPFALEEQLLSDVNELHFAVGAYQANGSVPVAIVSKEKMQAWITLLNEAGLSPATIIPASLALPVAEDTWNIYVSDHIAILRTDLFHGFGCEKDNLNALIELKLQEKTPTDIVLHNYTLEPVIPFITTANFTEKNFPAMQFLEDIALRSESPSINLLQGNFQAKRKASNHKKVWALASYTVVAWIGLVFFSNLISFSILHHQQSELDTQINSIYKRNFPQASAVVSPKDRMTQKLNTLLNQGNKNSLLIWLAYLGKTLAQVDGVHMQQLDYRNDQLSMELTGANFDKIDALALALKTQGLSVRQQNVAAAGNQVKGTLIISESKT